MIEIIDNVFYGFSVLGASVIDIRLVLACTVLVHIHSQQCMLWGQPSMNGDEGWLFKSFFKKRRVRTLFGLV